VISQFLLSLPTIEVIPIVDRSVRIGYVIRASWKLSDGSRFHPDSKVCSLLEVASIGRVVGVLEYRIIRSQNPLTRPRRPFQTRCSPESIAANVKEAVDTRESIGADAMLFIETVTDKHLSRHGRLIPEYIDRANPEMLLTGSAREPRVLEMVVPQSGFRSQLYRILNMRKTPQHFLALRT
jgi:hypothetical protein